MGVTTWGDRCLLRVTGSLAGAPSGNQTSGKETSRGGVFEPSPKDDGEEARKKWTCST